MSGVLYHTKSNNKEIKQLLDEPSIGRDLVKQIMLQKKHVDDAGNGKDFSEPKQFIIKAKSGKEMKVTELGYDIKIE